MLLIGVWILGHGQTRIPLTLQQQQVSFIPMDRDFHWGIEQKEMWSNFTNHPATSSALFAAPVGASWFVDAQLQKQKWAADDMFHMELSSIYQLPVSNNAKLNFAIGLGTEHQQLNTRTHAVVIGDPVLQYEVRNHVYSVAGVSFVHKLFFASVKNTHGVDYGLSDGSMSYLGSFDLMAAATPRMADDQLILMPFGFSKDFKSFGGGVAVSWLNQMASVSFDNYKSLNININFWMSSYLQVGLGYQHSGTVGEMDWLGASVTGIIRTKQVSH